MRTIYDFLDFSASIYPLKTALMDENRKLTYDKFLANTNQLSNFIQDNTKLGQVISLMAENSAEMLISYFAILKSGCIAHMIPTQTSDENLLLQIRETKPRLFFSTASLKNKIERSGCLTNTKFVDVKLNEMITNQEIKDFYGNRFHEISSIIFTSGTTGKPKGVILKHKNIVTATQNIVKRIGIQNDDIEINTLQLSHSFGLGCIHAIFSQGATSVIFRNTINLKHIVKTALEEKATGFSGVPATFRKFLDVCMDDLKLCRKYMRYLVTNSVRVPKETAMEIINLFPTAKFFTYYGLTEASRSTFLLFNENLSKIGSVGRPADGVQIKIIDEKGNTLPVNENGEICIKGPHVIESYWNNPEADSQIKDSWLHTGDLGYFDADDYLYLQGRTDDLINISGEKVSALEIETIIKQLDGIQDVVVMGEPNDIFGEIPIAYMVKTKPTLNSLDIIKHCGKKLESHKIPQKIIFTDSIPKTESGKIQKHLLRSKVT